MSVQQVTQDNFDQIQNTDKPILLDFYADWCGPCRMVSPLVDEIATENPEIVVGKINVDEEPELAQAFGVSSIPMLVVMKDGKIRAHGTLESLKEQTGKETLEDVFLEISSGQGGKI